MSEDRILVVRGLSIYGRLSKMKVAYVTGCAGFIGGHLTERLLNSGWQVRGVDKMTYAASWDRITQFKKYPNFVFEPCDINNLKFLYDCDCIFNCAAETHVGNSIVSSDDFIKSNVDGVHNILNLIKNFRQEGKEKPTLIHLSTDEVYSDIISGSHSETDILKPSSPYSASKACSDMLIQAWGRTYNIPYIIVRPTNNYGTHQYVEKLIPKTLKYIQLGRKLPLHNEGLPRRVWLHVKDTVDAILAVLECGELGEIYNISGNYEDSNFNVVRKVFYKYYNGALPSFSSYDDFLNLDHSRPGQDVRYSVNDSKLRKLGWGNIRNFDDSLDELVKFYKDKFIW